MAAAHPVRAPARTRRCCVLDEVAGLGADLAPAARTAARRAATAGVVRIPEGDAPLQRWYGSSLHGPGLLVLDGLLAREVHVADRVATELLGPGDLLRPWDLDEGDPVPSRVVWRTLAPCDLAVLDAFFADRIRRWPQIAAELMGAAVHRAEATALQRAIACHPRVDLRVVLVLWHLAGRWGTVHGDGSVHLGLPLTHRLLGELVGAERPSVSHAVRRLHDAGLLERDGDGWVLHGTVHDATEAGVRPIKPAVTADTPPVAAAVIAH